MRPIKFRALDQVLTQKRWFYSDEMGMADFWLAVALKNDRSMKSHQVIVCEATGLRDKNGVEVFEGDLIKIYQQESDARVIEVKIPDLWIEEFDSVVGLGHHNIEVIGNVYQK